MDPDQGPAEIDALQPRPVADKDVIVHRHHESHRQREQQGCRCSESHERNQPAVPRPTFALAGVLGRGHAHMMSAGRQGCARLRLGCIVARARRQRWRVTISPTELGHRPCPQGHNRSKAREHRPLALLVAARSQVTVPGVGVDDVATLGGRDDPRARRRLPVDVHRRPRRQENRRAEPGGDCKHEAHGTGHTVTIVRGATCRAWIRRCQGLRERRRPGPLSRPRMRLGRAPTRRPRAGARRLRQTPR